MTAQIKDTLLTQCLIFALTNKQQVRRFQTDHEKALVEKANDTFQRFKNL